MSVWYCEELDELRVHKPQDIVGCLNQGFMKTIVFRHGKGLKVLHWVYVGEFES